MARFMLEEDSYFDQAFRCDECLYCCSTQLQYDAHLSTEQHWLICELLSALPHYSKPSTSDLILNLSSKSFTVLANTKVFTEINAPC